ncbi:MAG: response regulator transcription factor [Lewinellaceae bacterium]|nr:response regulator transcription factor [Phaeodactylibacter sp.]MCB0615421.1 response regulator transcription factor [Phaeodactylibacter sp.]MCB9349718.1 response regulator transcription factor [Lewinellaceae bacterium]
MRPISIILADSQYLVRLGLRHLIRSKEQFKVVAEATKEPQLLEQVKVFSPQVVILDYNQPENFSQATVEHIKRTAPRTNILIISADNNKKNIYDILELGVNSYLTKACGEDEIVEAIKATARGEKFFCTKVLDFLLERTFAKNNGSESCNATPLTAREIEIVQLIAQGLIAKEIAGRLNLSTHTVYTHRKNIMKKLKFNTASELVLYAVNMGLVKNNRPSSQ